MLHHFTERIQVKCNQTGKVFRAKISTLSKDDMDSSLSAADLAHLLAVLFYHVTRTLT